MFALYAAADTDPWRFVTQAAGRDPTYRPVAFLSIWLQGRFADLNAGPYLVFNLVCWIGCAGALYALVYTLGRSRLAALVSSLALLLDSRAMTLLIWIDDRQTSLALLCGVLALLLLASRPPGRWHGGLLFSVFALLLGSALSKEYGFAFSGAAVVVAFLSARDHETSSWTSWMSRRHLTPVPLVVLAVAGAYLLLRLGVADGAVTEDFCQDQSFFRIRVNQQICYGDMDPAARAAQFLYNSVASVIGTVVPWVFSSTGALQRPDIDVRVLGFGLPMIGLAVVGLIKAPRQVLPLMSLVLFQGVLSFMLYRPRNQLIGVVGMYGSAGIGLAIVLAWLRAKHAPRAYGIALVGMLLFVLVLQARIIGRELGRERDDALKVDPCGMRNDKELSVDFIHRVKHFYALSNPNCL